MGVWVCGCVGVWVCGCVGVWVCGCVGVWVCGGVGVWGWGLWVGEGLGQAVDNDFLNICLSRYANIRQI